MKTRTAGLRCHLGRGWYISIMILDNSPEIQRLSASEKLIFVSELWNDLDALLS